MTDLKELSERLAWEALEKSGNTKTGRSVMREAADVLAALGETHVVVPVIALKWLNGEAPDHKGRWFGEDIQPGGGAFWWRSRFRDICAAVTSPDGGRS